MTSICSETYLWSSATRGMFIDLRLLTHAVYGKRVVVMSNLVFITPSGLNTLNNGCGKIFSKRNTTRKSHIGTVFSKHLRHIF